MTTDALTSIVKIFDAAGSRYAIPTTVPKAVKVAALEDAYRDDAHERFQVAERFVQADIETLQKIALAVAEMARKVEALVADLDTPALAGAKFRAANMDAYAIVEALLWDTMTDPAERLLKAQVAAAVAQ